MKDELARNPTLIGPRPAPGGAAAGRAGRAPARSRAREGSGRAAHQAARHVSLRAVRHSAPSSTTGAAQGARNGRRTRRGGPETPDGLRVARSEARHGAAITLKKAMRDDPTCIRAFSSHSISTIRCARLRLPIASTRAPAASRSASEMFVVAGPEPVRWMVERGFSVFLDLKFHDIPNTVAQACAVGEPPRRMHAQRARRPAVARCWSRRATPWRMSVRIRERRRRC